MDLSSFQLISLHSEAINPDRATFRAQLFHRQGFGIWMAIEGHEGLFRHDKIVPGFFHKILVHEVILPLEGFVEDNGPLRVNSGKLYGSDVIVGAMRDFAEDQP